MISNNNPWSKKNRNRNRLQTLTILSLSAFSYVVNFFLKSGSQRDLGTPSCPRRNAIDRRAAFSHM
ncbi:hypothetical protein M426DRAFT_221305 [Hypoxylon sp. CI-4A]|nr:hypothetical protein M426DRAFT_221305 [Hypoxylon sp. CI-4A]